MKGMDAATGMKPWTEERAIFTHRVLDEWTHMFCQSFSANDSLSTDHIQIQGTFMGFKEREICGGMLLGSSMQVLCIKCTAVVATKKEKKKKKPPEHCCERLFVFLSTVNGGWLDCTVPCIGVLRLVQAVPPRVFTHKTKKKKITPHKPIPYSELPLHVDRDGHGRLNAYNPLTLDPITNRATSTWFWHRII